MLKVRFPDRKYPKITVDMLFLMLLALLRMIARTGFQKSAR